ncbi:MAG: carbohydrate ABC transporter permease [Cyanobacteriota bacterium]
MGNVRIRKFIAYTILIIGALSMILPFIWMVLTSFMTNSQIFSYPPQIIPKTFLWENYTEVSEKIPLFRYFLNSLLVSIATVIGQIITCSMAAYAFARLNFKYKEFIFLIFLATMMIPPQVNIVPLFFLMRELHWIDTYWALIIPGIFGGFGIFLLRQWFLSFPAELEDAAKIDGCNPLETFWHIALPLALPAIVTLGIFSFITSWNSFMWPLIVTNSEVMKTLPVGLASFKGSFRETTEWAQLMAASVVSVIPVIVVFILGQKYFVKGIMMGAIKE